MGRGEGKVKKGEKGEREAKWGKIGERREGVGKGKEVRGNSCTTAVLPLSLKARPGIPEASRDGAVGTLSSVHICNSFWSSQSSQLLCGSAPASSVGGALLLVDPKKLGAAQCVPFLSHRLHCCCVG